MEKGRKKGFLAAGLLRLGAAIRFAPKTEYLPPLPEREEEKKKSLLPPFLDAAHRLRLKSVAARASEQSFLLHLLRAFTRAMLCARMRSYGVFFFLSGLVTTLSYFASNVVGVVNGTIEHLVVGIVQIILALWMSFDRVTLAASLKRSLFFRAALNPLFGVREWEIPDGSGKERPLVMALSGILMGIFSALFSPSGVLFVLLFAVVVLFVFYKPEAGLFLYAVSVLFLPAESASILIALTWISFFCKVLVGKRSLKFGKTDLLLIPAFLWILIGTSQVGRGLRFAAIASLYILCCNLIKTLENTKRLARCLSAGLGAAAALFALRSLLFSLFPYDNWREAALFGLIEEQSDLFLLLAMLLPVVFGFVRSSGTISARFFALAAAAACAFAFYSNGNPFLWIAVFAGLWIFAILSYRAGLLISLIALLFGGAVLPLLPGGVLRSLASLFGFSGGMWGKLHQGLLRAGEQFSSALLWGTGVEKTDPAGITGIYFEIGILFGVLGMAAFYTLLISFFFRCTVFCRATTRREIHPLVLGAMCGILTLLAAGFFLPFTSETTASVFLILLSFPKMAHRACEREETRLPY